MYLSRWYILVNFLYTAFISFKPDEGLVFKILKTFVEFKSKNIGGLKMAFEEREKMEVSKEGLGGSYWDSGVSPTYLRE